MAENFPQKAVMQRGTGKGTRLRGFLAVDRLVLESLHAGNR